MQVNYDSYRVRMNERKSCFTIMGRYGVAWYRSTGWTEGQIASKHGVMASMSNKISIEITVIVILFSR